MLAWALPRLETLLPYNHIFQTPIFLVLWGFWGTNNLNILIIISQVTWRCWVIDVMKLIAWLAHMQSCCVRPNVMGLPSPSSVTATPRPNSNFCTGDLLDIQSCRQTLMWMCCWQSVVSAAWYGLGNPEIWLILPYANTFLDESMLYCGSYICCYRHGVTSEHWAISQRQEAGCGCVQWFCFEN